MGPGTSSTHLAVEIGEVPRDVGHLEAVQDLCGRFSREQELERPGHELIRRLARLAPALQVRRAQPDRVPAAVAVFNDFDRAPPAAALGGGCDRHHRRPGRPWATSSRVTGASRIPVRVCPVATTRPGCPGAGPITGCPSGLAGREPGPPPPPAALPGTRHLAP